MPLPMDIEDQERTHKRRSGRYPANIQAVKRVTSRQDFDTRLSLSSDWTPEMYHRENTQEGPQVTKEECQFRIFLTPNYVFEAET